MKGLVHLALSGDLYRPPEFDVDGNIVPRGDTVSGLPADMNAGRLSGDAAPMLMAELDRVQAELAAAKAGK